MSRPIAAVLAAVWTLGATATPQNGVFVYGDGTITYYGGGLATVVELLGPDRFVIGWDDFDVSSNESVTFNGVDFTVLNTINFAAPESSWIIDGAINAPGGEVWFVNPAGVMFGENAVLDVGGVLAAAGSIDAAQFMAGNDVFNLTGDVHFAGTMSTVNGMADRAIFLGHHVQNTGLITGNIIVMASGDTIRLIDLGTRITLEVDSTALNAEAAAAGSTASMSSDAWVTNHGRLETESGGQVLLASGDALGAALPWGGLAIEHDGEIMSAGGDVQLIALDGAIRTDQFVEGGNAFVSNAGLIDVSSDTGGGTIDITGPAVVIGSALRAQGGVDGGGGDVHLRASRTIVLAGDELAGWTDDAAGHQGTGTISVAGGSGSGDGGSVLIDAGDGRAIGATGSAVTALGGVQGGDGGRIDILAGALQWNSRARASASSGEAGLVTYTSDASLRITADGSSGTADFGDLLAAGNGDAFLGAQLSQSLGLVDSDLSVTSNGAMTFETSIAGLPVEDGPSRLYKDAHFTADTINLADASGQTSLWAGGTLGLHGDIVMVNSDVVLVAGRRDQVSGMELGGAIRATGEYRGSLDLSSPGVIELGGDIGLEGFEIGSLTLRSVDRMNFISGNRAIRAMGDVTLASADGGLFELNMDGDLLIEAGNDITFGDGLTLQGNQSLTATAGGLLTNRAVTDVAGDLSFSGGTIDNTRALTSGGDMSLTATAGALNADVALTSGGFIALEGRDGVQSSVALTTTGGDITVHSLEGGITTTAAIDSSGVVELVAALDINSTASINASGSRGTTDESIIMTSDGAITLGDVVTSTGGDVLIDAGTSLQVAHVQGGNVSLAAGTTASIASVIAQSTATVIAQGELLVQDMQALDATLTGNTVALTGTLSATSANVSGLDVTLAGTVDIVDALDVQASGDLRLEGVTTAGTMSLRADGTAILDGALLHSTQTGFMGGDSLLLQATDMRVLGNTSMVADGGLLTITGTSSNGSYSATDMTLEGGDLSVVTELDALRFIANVDGAHDLSLSANAVLYLGGDLGSTDALANITLNGVDGLQLGGAVPLSSDALDVNVIAAVQTVVLQENHADLILDGVATILGFSEALSVTASEGDIRLGNNQSFVQLGDLSMTAGGDILVTDVTTEGNLHMTAHQVLVHQRDPMIILVSDGTGLVSTQASIVAGGNLIIDATTVGTSGGLGETALFGALGGVTGAPEGQIGVSAQFDREDLMLSGPAGTTQLLLRWLQQSVGDDSTLIAAESQSTPAEPVFEIEASNEEALTTETLSELGIIVRALDVEHVDAMRQGRPGQLTVDLVSGPGPAQVGRVVVTRHRLLRSQVHQAVARWRAAWAHDRATQAGGGMSWAHASTEAQAGSSGDQAAFARLKVGIAETYRHLALSGLTPSELQASKTFVANDLISRGAGAAAVGHLLN